MREVTVTGIHFKVDGSEASRVTTRHRLGYRLDQRASLDYPYDNPAVEMNAKTGDQTVTVTTKDGRILAKYEMTPDAEEE